MEDSSNWDPAGSKSPDVGVIGDDHTVTFKTGKEGSSKEGHTLIADGEQDAASFDANHAHHGPSFSEDRGAYTGPGSEKAEGKDNK